jgi:hypothetical protein
VDGRAEQEEDVGERHVGPDRLGVPGAHDEHVEGLEQGVADVGDALVTFADRLQERQVALLAALRGHGQELEQRSARIGRVGQAPGDGDERGEVLSDDRGDQVVLGGEVAEDRALRDARPAGDVGDRRRQAALGELVL